MILSQSLGITVLCSNHVNDKTASLLFSTEILPVRADLQSDPHANVQSDLVCGCYRSLFASLDLFFLLWLLTTKKTRILWKLSAVRRLAD